MTIPYTLEGRRYYGVVATWDRAVKRVNSDGTVTYMPYADHTWQIQVVHMVDYTFLQTQRGMFVDLITTDIDNLNVQKTYNGAELADVQTQQVGRNATAVSLTFKVKV